MVTQKEHRECVGARRLAWRYYGTIPLKGLCTFTAHTPFNTSDAANDAAVMRCSANRNQSPICYHHLVINSQIESQDDDSMTM
jgi:hypothetical protein